MTELKATLRKVFDQYLDKYSAQAPATITSKTDAILPFIDSIPDECECIGYEEIEAWISSLTTHRNTTNGKIRYVRQFLRFARMFGIHSAEPETLRCEDTYRPYIFTEEEIVRIFYYVDNIDEIAKGPRSRLWFPMLIRLLTCTGMRVSEALSIQLKDYNENLALIHLHKTKNRKERYVPLESKMNTLVQRYKQRLLVSFPDTSYLFPQENTDGPICRKQVAYAFSVVLREAGIKRLVDRKQRGPCIHCLRHYFTVNSYRQICSENKHDDINLPFLSAYLGHETLAETERYLKFETDLYPEVIDAMDSVSNSVFEGFEL